MITSSYETSEGKNKLKNHVKTFSPAMGRDREKINEKKKQVKKFYMHSQTPPHEQNVTQSQFKLSLTGVNPEFSFS